MRKNQRNLSLHIFLFFFLIIARYKRAPHGGTALSLNIWPQKPWLKNYHSFLMVDLNPFPFFKIPLPILNPSCFFKKPFITTVTTVSLLESSIVSLQSINKISQGTQCHRRPQMSGKTHYQS